VVSELQLFGVYSVFLQRMTNGILLLSAINLFYFMTAERENE
jgi:hypothetical protein